VEAICKSITTGYRDFSASQLYLSIFRILSSSLADIVSYDSYIINKSSKSLDMMLGESVPFKARFLNLEIVLSELFSASLDTISVPTRVGARQGEGNGCRGILLRYALTTGCDNKVCPQCYATSLVQLHDAVASAFEADHSIITSTLRNPVELTKVEQEFTQASRKSISDLSSITAGLSKFQAKIPHVTQVGDSIAAGYSMISIVHNTRIDEYVTLAGAHGRYDICRPAVFSSPNEAYLDSCFNYPTGLLLPENRLLLEQFLIHSGSARRIIPNYGKKQRDIQIEPTGGSEGHNTDCDRS